MLRFELSRRRTRQIMAALAVSNVVFVIGTIAFIRVWDRIAEYPPLVQRLITLVLVQCHLGTENVIAAWYSSMMLLAVASCSAAALVVDRGDRTRRYGWTVMAAAFTLLSFDEIGSLHERVGMIAALNPLGDRALGWVIVLAVPIACVAGVLCVFAWRHLRQTPLALASIVAGVALFVSDPVLEQFEMSLLHRNTAGVWSRSIHDALLVFEEGVAELFGTWCFLAGVLIYLRVRLDGRPIEVSIGPRSARVALAIGGLLTAGAFLSPQLVQRLPAGDTGIPENWFPAAGGFLTAVIALALRHGLSDGERRGARALAGFAAVSLMLSAYFGAGLFAYETGGWFERVKDAGVALTVIVYAATAGLIVAADRRRWMVLLAPATMAVALAVHTQTAAPFATLASVLACAGFLTETSVSHVVSMESWRLENSAAERGVATLARSSRQPNR
jgi:hypothetical protein